MITKEDVLDFKLLNNENSLIGLISYKAEPIYIFATTLGEKYLKQIITAQRKNYDATRLVEILVNEVPLGALSVEVLKRITNEEVASTNESAAELGNRLKKDYIKLYSTHMSVGGANMERVAGLNYEIAANSKFLRYYKGTLTVKKNAVKPTAQPCQKIEVHNTQLKPFSNLAALSQDKLNHIREGQPYPGWLNSAHVRACKEAGIKYE